MTQNGTTGSFEMKHIGSRRLFEYWSDLRGGRVAPYKAEVSAQGIGRTLASNTFILENLGEGNLRFRLAGSRLYDIFGLEVRGMSALAIMSTESRTQFRALIEEALSESRVAVCQAEATTPNGLTVCIEIILAPLRSDFDQLNRMLGAVHVLNIEEEDLICAPRRCSIIAAATLNFGASDKHISAMEGPLPGFADEAEGFDHDGPPFRAIEGGKPGASERRKGHLKVVKD